MEKQSVDKTARPAIRFILRPIHRQKVSDRMVSWRVAWKYALLVMAKPMMVLKKQIPVDCAPRRLIGMQNWVFPSSSAVFDFPIPVDWTTEQNGA